MVKMRIASEINKERIEGRRQTAGVWCRATNTAGFGANRSPSKIELWNRRDQKLITDDT